MKEKIGMKKILVVITILFFISLVSLIGLSFYISSQKNFFSEIIQSELQHFITSEISIENAEVSLFKRFPNISIELKNVNLIGANQTDTTLSDHSAKELLNAKRVFLEFNLIDFLKKNYTVKEISFENGNFFIEQSIDGYQNFDILAKTETKSQAEFDIALEKVNFSQITFIAHLNSGIFIESNIHNLHLKLNIEKEKYIVSSKGRVLLRELLVSETFSLVDEEIRFESAGKLEKNELLLHFSEFHSNKIELDILLSYQLNLNEFRLELNLPLTNLSSIVEFLPSETATLFEKYHIQSKVKLNARIESLAGNNHYKIDGSLSNGRLSYPEVPIDIEKLEIQFKYSNTGNQNDTLIIESCKGSTNKKSDFDLAGVITELHRPNFEINTNFNFLAADLKSWFPDFSIDCQSAMANMKILGNDWNLKSDFSDNLNRIKPEGKLSFESLFYRSNELIIEIPQLNLEIQPQEIKMPDFDLIINENEFSLTGFFVKDYLAAFEKKTYEVGGLIISSSLDLNQILSMSDTASSSKCKGFALPRNLLSKISIKCDSLFYQKIKMAQVETEIFTSYRKLGFDNIKAKGFHGHFGGKLLLQENSANNFTLSSQIQLNTIDIHELLYYTDDFHQDFISHQNLLGELNGDFALNFTFDTCLNINSNLTEIVAQFEITDGELFDFKALESLSKFIDLEELQHIRFNQLQNELRLKNGVLSIPTMFIGSSLVDFYINGSHKLDGDLDLRMDLYLSKLLSKKKRSVDWESQSGSTDALGRRHIYLKTSGKADNLTISYDKNGKSFFKGEKEKLKEIHGLGKTEVQSATHENPNKDSEKRSLKEIFNRTESIDSIEKTEKPRHRIEWE